MISRKKIRETRERRIERIRYKLKKNGSSPRLVLNKTNRYLIAQIVDDKSGNTLAFATSSEKTFPIQGYSRKNKKSAAELGKIIAERAKLKGITTVMMDRSGAIYHGNISVFADSARQGGLQF
jgi:large subunit ribosomal protein L18